MQTDLGFGDGMQQVVVFVEGRVEGRVVQVAADVAERVVHCRRWRCRRWLG